MTRDGDLDETASGGRAERIRELIADCLRRRAGGETVSDQSIIDAHADLTPDLAEELAKLRRVEAAWEEAADGKPDDGPAETFEPAGLHIRCPHCHNPVEVVIDTPLTDIACSACGSHFSFVDDDNTYTASAVKTLGHFETIEHLGTGAFGAVWRARDTELDRTVALKIPRKGQLTPAETEQFLREARAAAQLRHPNIVSVHEVGREGDTLFIVSDLVSGLSLSDWLSAVHPTSREAVELCVKLAEALHHAHEAGVIHRDLKPSNIMIDASGQPHIMDFGLAKREAGEITVTMDGRPLGTPAYMSPEQAQGQAHLATGRSDVYSLGVIFFEMLTGELPFRGNTRMLIQQVIHDEAPSLRKLNSSIPRDLETICLKCLEKAPSGRYPTAQVLADELHRFLRGEPIHARPVSAPARLWRWCKRKPLVAALTGAVALALLVGTGVSSYFAFEAGRQAKVAKRNAKLAEAARQAEAEQRALAEAREKQARQNFQMALEAVNRYFTLVSEDPRLKAYGLEKLRNALLRAAREFYEQFVDGNPDDPKLKAEYGRAHYRLGEIGLVIGKLADAEKAYRAARGIQQQLVDGPTAVPEHRYDLAMSYLGLGKVHAETRRQEAAKGAYLKALGTFGLLVAEHPDVPTYQRPLAESYRALGFLYLDAGRRVGTQMCFDTALRLRESLALRDPEDLALRNDLAEIHSNRGILYTKTRDLSRARQAYRSALGIREPLVVGYPTEYRRYLAADYNNLGVVYKESDRLDEANEEFHKALAIYGPLSANHPDVLEYRINLSNTYRNLGNVLSKSAPDDAVPWYTKAIEALKPAPGEAQSSEHAKNVQRFAYEGRARVFTDLKRHKEAAADWLQASSLARGVAHKSDRVDYLLSLARSGDYEGAVDKARKMGHEIDDAVVLYNVARVCCIAAEAGKADTSLSEAERSEMSQQYANEAIGWLAKALARGFDNFGHLRSVPEPAILRDHPGYKKLVSKMFFPLQADLVPVESVWKYLDAGSSPQAGWSGTDFDDSRWKSGPRPLGYGDGDEATVIGSGRDPRGKYVTMYLRHTFKVSNVRDVRNLLLGLVRDDGVAIYLNGTEVFRDNPRPGAGPDDYAPARIAGENDKIPEESEWRVSYFPLKAGLLVEGDNILAVEIHQDARDSSDVIFALTVSGNVVPILEKALADPHAYVRRESARALGSLGSAARKAVPALLKALDDKDGKVRGAAAHSLGEIGGLPDEVVPKLIETLGDHEAVAREAAWALERFAASSGNVVPALIESLRGTDSSPLRTSLCRLLGTLGPEAAAARTVLERLRDDDNTEVCVWAAAALIQMAETPRDLRKPRHVDEKVLRAEAAISLNNTAWMVARSAGRKPHEYAAALRAARAACALRPEDGNSLNTLGVALYRTGNFRKAIVALNNSEELSIERHGGSYPPNLAFLAMAHHRLGETTKGQEYLASLRRLMQSPKRAKDVESRGFLREAERLIDGSAERQKSDPLGQSGPNAPAAVSPWVFSRSPRAPLPRMSP